MPVYVEMVKDKKTRKPIEKTINGHKQYYVRTYITDESGNRKQITRHNKEWIGTDGKRAAIAEDIRLQKEYKVEKKKTITLRNLKELYLESLCGKVDIDTIEAKKRLLKHFCDIDLTGQVKTFPDKEIRNFTRNDILKWQQQMVNKKYKVGKSITNNLSIKYLNKIYGEINRMIKFAIIEGYCEQNFVEQCGKFGSPKEIKLSNSSHVYETINYEEFLKLKNASESNLKYNTFFILEFSRGLRIGEIRALRIEDYNSEKKQLMVNHTMSKKNILKEPKTASSKAPVDLNEELNLKITKLINYWKEQDGFNEKWYIFNGEHPISENALRCAKDKYFKLANIQKHIRIHDFRHSCATWLNSINIPITVISKILRHASVNETLKTYTHLFKEDYANCMKKIDNYQSNYSVKQDQKQDQNFLKY